MKKIIVITLLSMFVAGTALANTGTTTGGQALRATAPATIDIAKASKNVSFGYNTSATGYALATFHTQGTKMYGTGYDSTKLYFIEATAVAAPASSVTTEAFPSGTWTEM